ncbi:hypothetical protein FCV25MIE_14712 [Fagus crenata]
MEEEFVFRWGYNRYGGWVCGNSGSDGGFAVSMLVAMVGFSGRNGGGFVVSAMVVVVGFFWWVWWMGLSIYGYGVGGASIVVSMVVVVVVGFSSRYGGWVYGYGGGGGWIFSDYNGGSG